MKKDINVTKPFLPPLEELLEDLKAIWESGVVTNGGPYHQCFERRLAEYLGVEFISVFTNATIALIVAIKAAKLEGEVITTPYSFIATSHALAWNGLIPKFIDIRADTLNIDESKITEAINERTSAILAVHCYGIPCNFEKIKRIASNFNLKVIYDAAHAFAVRDGAGNSILNNGNFSILSFHATKVFNTLEGGAIVSSTKEDKALVDKLRNFGIKNEVEVTDIGINGKMSEIHACIGLRQLDHIDSVIKKRKYIYQRYKKNIDAIQGIKIVTEPSAGSITWNYSYFPIEISDSYPVSRDNLYDKFKLNGINVRKYFYPLISSHDVYSNLALNGSGLINANYIAERVLCLPLYPELEDGEIDFILNLMTYPLD